jgi:ribose 5-phosphate isomerase
MMEALKKNAGEEAAKRIQSGQRIGLGTGSTETRKSLPIL